jgi:hypothetical protein
MHHACTHPTDCFILIHSLQACDGVAGILLLAGEGESNLPPSTLTPDDVAPLAEYSLTDEAAQYAWNPTGVCYCDYMQRGCVLWGCLHNIHAYGSWGN